MRGRTRSDVLMEDDSMEGQGADGQCSSGETWSLTLIHDDRGSVMEVHLSVRVSFSFSVTLYCAYCSACMSQRYVKDRVVNFHDRPTNRYAIVRSKCGTLAAYYMKQMKLLMTSCTNCYGK